MRTPYARVPIFLAIGATWILGCDGTAAEQGESLFYDPKVTGSDASPYACSSCHEAVPGDAGDEILSGSPLAGVVSRPSYWGGQEIELLRSVNHCLYYFMFENQPWTAQDEESRAIYAFLESLGNEGTSDPAPFTVIYEVYDVPRGDTDRGEDLYSRACQSCHGAAHTGDAAFVAWSPVLPEDFLADHPDAEYTAEEQRLVMVEKIRHGAFVGYSGQMPPFSAEKLSDADLGDVLEFLDIISE